MGSRLSIFPSKQFVLYVGETEWIAEAVYLVWCVLSARSTRDFTLPRSTKWGEIDPFFIEVFYVLKFQLTRP